MGKYKIKYNYDTGDSFNNDYDLSEYLELEFNDIKVAKDNLNRIKEHYDQYKELNKHSFSNQKTDEEILTSNQNKDWFVKIEKPCIYYMDNGKRKYSAIDESKINFYKENAYEVGTFIDSMSASNLIILYTDQGKPFQFWAPWCGYFETLNYVEIEDNSSDRKIVF